MRGSITPFGKDGPFDVIFFPSGKDGAVSKYSAKDFAELERVLASLRIKLTEEQVEKLESEEISIPNLNPTDAALKRYCLI